MRRHENATKTLEENVLVRSNSSKWQKVSVEFSIPEGCNIFDIRLKACSLHEGECAHHKT